MKNAYFAGGCFWCISSYFYNLPGVKKVTSGYSGGDEVNPTYSEVKNQLTSHRETINIQYDPSLVSFGELLDLFLRNIDPLDDGGQFIDRGRSYSTAIYYTCEEEKTIALEKLNVLQTKFEEKIKVSVEAFKSFYEAEEEHQNYSIKNPEAFEKELIASGRKKI